MFVQSQSAGKRSTPVTISRYVDTTTESGEVVRNWTELYSCRVSVNSESGNESVDSNQMQAEMNYQFIANKKDIPNIKTSDRVNYGDCEYQIISLLKGNDQQQFIVINAKVKP